MPEVDIGFPRTFVEFTNPEDATEVFRCDLTWLTSRWTCIFGSGCQGIYASSPDTGCCTLGAHFADESDHERVGRYVDLLTAEQWQHHAQGHTGGWTETDDDGKLKTRVVGGACIFHNDREFGGGYGCALHAQALEAGIKPHLTKPDVCWQLPTRRQFREVDRGDGTAYTEVQIGEYTRGGWGRGGHDLDWYCSSNTEAHVGRDPVYVSNRDELVAMMGESAYAELVLQAEAHLTGPLRTPHAADPH